VADVLVVGANGFLGSHLVDALVAAGHQVTAFDRFSRDEPGFSAEPARIVRGDFLSRTDLESAVAGNRIVFHFLSTSTPATADDDPGFDVRTNVAQSVELFEICADAGVEHIYFASTGGAIYGDQDRAEYREGDPALPVSPYAIGKLAIERYLAYFGARRGMRATALRISNPYGPRQRSQRGQGLIALSLARILSGEPVHRFGDGGMIRDYIHVSDLVRMIVAIVDGDPVHPVYNLGSGVGTSVNQVLDAIRDATGIDFPVVEMPVPKTFVRRVVLDTSRFTDEFGIVSSVGLVEGIKETYVVVRGGK
jgi:UDP-glucose 4-epimerase